MADKFKVEALSIVDHIHRTFTMADKRESAHSALANYHDYNHQRAMNKYRKASARADRYKEGSKKNVMHRTIAEHHLNKAIHHGNQMAKHADKSFNASTDGYEHRNDMRRLANAEAFKHSQRKAAIEANKPAVPTLPKTVAPPVVKPKKPASANPDIVTPTKVPRIEPTLKALTPKPPRVSTPNSRLGRRVPGGTQGGGKSRIGIKKILKSPIHKATKAPKAPKPANLNVKATPLVTKPIKPIKVPGVKATPKNKTRKAG
jgi:hypothetical protein